MDDSESSHNTNYHSCTSQHTRTHTYTTHTRTTTPPPGGYSHGDKEGYKKEMEKACEYFAARGYVAISMTYRLAAQVSVMMMMVVVVVVVVVCDDDDGGGGGRV